MRRPRPIVLALLGSGALVALIAAIPVLVTSPAGPSTGAATSSSPRATLGATPAASAALVDASAFGWLFAGVVHERSGAPLPRYHLVAGDGGADGPLLAVDVVYLPNPAFAGTDRQPAAAGPVGGRVVVVADDGRTSTVRTIAVADASDDRVVAEIDDVVWSVAVTGDGSFAYLQLSARDEPRETGVVRVALDGSGMEQVLPPAQLGAAGDLRLAAKLTFQAGLALAVDDSMLARTVCDGDAPCLTEIVHLGTGESARFPRLALVGMLDGVAVVSEPCGNAPPFTCSLTAIDIASGARRVLAEDTMGAVVALHRGRGIVVYGAAVAANPTQLRAVDPVDGRDIHLIDADAGAAFHVGLEDAFRAPSGWAVVSVSEGGRIGVSLDGMPPVDLQMQIGDGEAWCVGGCVNG